MQHVIIGAGPAGVVAAETLHKLDYNASITLIGDEPEPPYSRMALPYYLTNSIDETGTHLRKDRQHFGQKNIDIVQNRVSAIDTASKTLALDGNSSLSYDKLLIATGSRPVTPPIPGIDSPGVYNCWTLEDGRNIAKHAQPGSKVVLIGAGFIGCIILEALASRGVDLVVIEMEDRMVPRMLNQSAGGMIRQWCENKGVTVYISSKVDTIESNSGRHMLTVKLGNGEILPADLIISATGVTPNTEFLQNTDIKTDAGILVNHHLQTSNPDIYAAGDVAQGIDFSTGEYSVHAIQPTAVDHGRVAASNMAGLTYQHRGSVNMNVLDTLGLISCSFGLWMGIDNGEQAELQDAGRYRYINLQFKDDVIVGASTLGMTNHVGVLRGLIQSKLRLGKWKQHLQRDPTRIMEAYLASTQAIGGNTRVL